MCGRLLRLSADSVRRGRSHPRYEDRLTEYVTVFVGDFGHGFLMFKCFDQQRFEEPSDHNRRAIKAGGVIGDVNLMNDVANVPTGMIEHSSVQE
jgi:hypothetical protein